ncbi:Manganese ABC transporter substrate-binding lipoprotein precursor [Planctomycetes bacterium Pla163]|uniref:Manganese ABC transporter substrate-binding lipoprotein n=1 Tax=Rohdeia mirabilis TaxID=2528008 RepID=A0A518D3D3_9BACT|nr:Manganese ABC transporter substrate-binding lipoprotein precursor [Planctomycetes bacterium Pla163]
MKRISFGLRAGYLLAAVLSLSIGTSDAHAAGNRADEPLDVVVTIADLGDLARQIGGERVDVTILARPGQNLHAVRVKPSHLVAVSRADAFVQVGLALEHAWVPGLLEAARNASVAPGRPGFVDAGAGYRAIQVPERLDRAVAADVHPLGNPHINMAVDGGPLFAKRILASLVELAPDHAEEFRARHEQWMERYEFALVRWTVLAERMAAAEEKSGGAFYVAEFHNEYDYLLGFLGVDVAATVEPAPGLPPTPGHLRSIDEILRRHEVPAVLTAPWSDNSTTRRVARSIDAEVVVLPTMLTDDGSGLDWIGWVDGLLVRIAGIFSVEPPSHDQVRTRRAEVEREAAAAADAGRDADAPVDEGPSSYEGALAPVRRGTATDSM